MVQTAQSCIADPFAGCCRADSAARRLLAPPKIVVNPVNTFFPVDAIWDGFDDALRSHRRNDPVDPVVSRIKEKRDTQILSAPAPRHDKHVQIEKLAETRGIRIRHNHLN